MTFRGWLGSWRPARRRNEEREMHDELAALREMAAPGQLGNLTLAMEDARSAWTWAWFDSLVADLRYALRTLRRQPGFLAVAVLSLGLAVGANSAMFSFADALLLRPLPVPNSSGLFDITYTTADDPFEGMSYPDYRDVREKARSLSALVAYRLTTLAAATNQGATAQVRRAALVSQNFFPGIQAAPAIGRTFTPEEAIPGGPAAAMVSYEFWKQQYAGDPAIIGSSLRLNGIVFTVIGVTPDSFTGLDRFVRPTIFVPLAMARRLEGDTTDPLEDRGRRDLVVKGRLRAGSSPASAQAELSSIGAALAREYPKENRNRRLGI